MTAAQRQVQLACAVFDTLVAALHQHYMPAAAFCHTQLSNFVNWLSEMKHCWHPRMTPFLLLPAAAARTHKLTPFMFTGHGLLDPRQLLCSLAIEDCTMLPFQLSML